MECAEDDLRVYSVLLSEPDKKIGVSPFDGHLDLHRLHDRGQSPPLGVPALHGREVAVEQRVGPLDYRLCVRSLLLVKPDQPFPIVEKSDTCLLFAAMDGGFGRRRLP